MGTGCPSGTFRGEGMPPNERRQEVGAVQPTAGVLFDLLWETLAEVLGTGATAALLRRAIKRAASRDRDLRGLVIERNGFGYEYQVPDTWIEGRGAEPLEGLQALMQDLQPILEELTGPVLVRRLLRV